MDKIPIFVVGFSIALGLAPFILDDQLLETYENEFYVNGSVYTPDDIDNATVRGDFDPHLAFGEVPKEFELVKSLNLQTDRPTLSVFSTEGNVSEVVDYPRYKYYSQPDEAEIAFNGTEPSLYEGKLQMKTWRAEEGVAERWLDVRHWYYSLRY